jgi:class 3 adenylate cyclase
MGSRSFFNDPIHCVDHTEHAVRLALDTWGKVEELARESARKARREHTAYGSVIISASRLCDEAKPRQIVTSQLAFAAVEQWFWSLTHWSA